MNDQELIASLADTMYKTRVELDAMRTILIAAIATINAEPLTKERFKLALAGAINGDAAIAIASPMSDQMLTDRASAMRRMLPPDVQTFA